MRKYSLQTKATDKLFVATENWYVTFLSIGNTQSQPDSVSPNGNPIRKKTEER